MTMAQPLHATTVARFGPQGWRAVLIQGPSGVGKSDLGLRLVAQGWRLVADDWTHVWVSQGALYATCPRGIIGCMEVRGLGVIAAPLSLANRPIARLALAVACTHDPIERLPDAKTLTFQGVSVPQLQVDPRPASAGLVVTTAFAAL